MTPERTNTKIKRCSQFTCITLTSSRLFIHMKKVNINQLRKMQKRDENRMMCGEGKLRKKF